MKNENNEEKENFDQLIIESKELEHLALENKDSKISIENENKDEKFTSFKKDTNFRFNFIENPLYKDLLDKELFSSKEIRIDEKDKYVFTLNGMYKLLLDLSNDTTLKKNHDKKMLKLYNSINPVYSKDFYLGKAEYCIPKTDLPQNISVKELFYNMFDPNKRKIWDKSIKSVQLIDTILEISPNLKCYTYHTWFKSPMLLVSERDIIEKRIDIIEDGYAMMLGFSLPNDYISEQKKVIRCLNYLNIQIVEERKDYFLFINYGCGDLKMPIPESLLNFTLPSKYNDWFKEFTKSFKK